MRILFVFIFFLIFVSIAQSQQTYAEYADLLVEAYYSGANPEYNDFYGEDIKVTHKRTGEPYIWSSGKIKPINPSVVLGINPDYVSLPTGSYVIIKFTNNVVIDVANQDDIFITEKGCANDRAEVYISSDGKTFTFLGIVGDCKTNSLDLASIGFKDVVRFVKVVGLDNNGVTPGYDLVNIKGLPGASIDTYLGMDSLDRYFREPLKKISQKIILDNIQFEYNKATLLPESQTTLDLLASKLTAYPKVKIKLLGHTDNTGEEASNQKLSVARALSVKNYLIKKGIPIHQLSSEGRGEKEPLKSNDNEANRAINRRVEIERIN